MRFVEEEMIIGIQNIREQKQSSFFSIFYKNDGVEDVQSEHEKPKTKYLQNFITWVFINILTNLTTSIIMLSQKRFIELEIMLLMLKTVCGVTNCSNDCLNQISETTFVNESF